jgi:hypothetical protein
MESRLLEKQKTNPNQHKHPNYHRVPEGENIAHPGHQPQVGDHAWVVPISKKWAKVPKVSQSTANGPQVTTKPRYEKHSVKTNLHPFDSLRSLRAFRPVRCASLTQGVPPQRMLKSDFAKSFKTYDLPCTLQAPQKKALV